MSMAPLSHEIRPVTSCCPPHFGPAVPEVNSVWFKLFIYEQVKSGPPSLLLVKGTRLRWLPKIFEVIFVFNCLSKAWYRWERSPLFPPTLLTAIWVQLPNGTSPAGSVCFYSLPCSESFYLVFLFFLPPHKPTPQLPIRPGYSGLRATLSTTKMLSSSL